MPRTFGRHGQAEEVARKARCVIARVDHRLDLAFALRIDFAYLERNERTEGILFFSQALPYPAYHATAHRRRNSTPDCERIGSSTDGLFARRLSRTVNAAKGQSVSRRRGHKLSLAARKRASARPCTRIQPGDGIDQRVVDTLVTHAFVRLIAHGDLLSRCASRPCRSGPQNRFCPEHAAKAPTA